MKTKPFIVALMLISSFVTWASAQVEVWVTPTGVDGSGDGTRLHPYVCASEVSFDTLMHSSTLPANSTIHLEAGVFLTGGNIPLRAGWKLNGAGIDQTIVRLASYQVLSATYSHNPAIIKLSDRSCSHLFSSLSWDYRSDGVVVSNLTVDCNLQGQTGPLSLAVGAIYLLGGDTKICRVKAINWGSANSNLECPVIVIGCAAAIYPGSSNCLIEDCIVDQPAPVIQHQGSDGIVIGGDPSDMNQLYPGTNGWISGAEIRNCRVLGVRAGNGIGEPNYFISLSMGNGVNHSKIDGNLVANVTGMDCAIGSSCGSLVDCEVYSNRFVNVSQGISYASYDWCPDNTKSLKRNIRIHNNFISVQTGGFGFNLSGIFTNRIGNVTIANNVVQASAGAGPIKVLITHAMDGLIVSNNILDAHGGTVFDIATNVTVSSMMYNRTPAGKNLKWRHGK